MPPIGEEECPPISSEVENVLDLVQEGISFKTIVADYYPDLEIEDSQACAKYAVDLIRSEKIDIEGLESM